MNQASTPNSTAEFFEDFEELHVSTELAEFQNGYFTDQDCSSRQFVVVIFPVCFTRYVSGVLKTRGPLVASHPLG